MGLFAFGFEGSQRGGRFCDVAYCRIHTHTIGEGGMREAQRESGERPDCIARPAPR